MRPIIWIAILVIVAAGGFLLFRNRPIDTINPEPTASSTENSTGDIVVNFPKPGDNISSPLKVSGKARGSWYFEASAPFKITDANGKVLATSHIQAEGEWMTTDYVPFTGTISFSTATGTATSTSGFVVFENDNPSGDPKLSKSVSIPIYFK